MSSFQVATQPSSGHSSAHQMSPNTVWNPSTNSGSVKLCLMLKRFAGKAHDLPTPPNIVLQVGYHWRYVGDRFVKAKNPKPNPNPTKKKLSPLMKAIQGNRQNK